MWKFYRESGSRALPHCLAATLPRCKVISRSVAAKSVAAPGEPDEPIWKRCAENYLSPWLLTPSPRRTWPGRSTRIFIEGRVNRKETGQETSTSSNSAIDILESELPALRDKELYLIESFHWKPHCRKANAIIVPDGQKGHAKSP